MKLLFYLWAKAILLAFGLWQGYQLPEHDQLILCLFLALAASFFAPLPRRKILQALPLALGSLLPFLYPEALGFLPLLLFDAVTLGLAPVLLPGMIAMFVQEPVWQQVLFTTGSGMMAALLALALKENSSLRKALSHVRDEAEENQLAHQAEQRARSEKQDAEVYAAILAERNRIAREIHDNVGHMLSRSILLTGAMKTVHKEDALLQGQLEVLDQSLNEAMTSIRESVHDLYEDSMDLEQAAAALASEFTFCPVSLNCRISSPVPRNVSYCLLAIIKEALVNISRHSTATQARIDITEHPALWQMTIEDNGRPGTIPLHADPAGEDPFSARAGMGLINMRERVEQLSGIIHFSRDNGFRIFLSIPKEAS